MPINFAGSVHRNRLDKTPVPQSIKKLFLPSSIKKPLDA